MNNEDRFLITVMFLNLMQKYDIWIKNLNNYTMIQSLEWHDDTFSPYFGVFFHFVITRHFGV